MLSEEKKASPIREFINVSTLSSGLYFLKIVNSKGNSIGKFMTAKMSYILQSNTAQEAALKMDQDSASALIVLDSNKTPVGVVTHRDLVRSSCIEDVPCNSILVQDIMSTPIVTIDPYSPVETAADVMKIKSAKTVQGQNVKVKVKKGKVMIDKSTVVKADIMTSNGVIHVIDTVLMPK